MLRSMKGSPWGHQLAIAYRWCNQVDCQDINSGRQSLRRFLSSLPAHTIVGMPSLSPTMTEGALIRWRVKEGSVVESGDTIAEIETDKATLDFDTMDEGVIARLLVEEGTKEIQVGTPIAVLVEDEEHVQHFKDYTSSNVADARDAAAKTSIKETSALPSIVKIGPAARKLAAEKGIALSTLRPTGPKGIITKEDVFSATSSVFLAQTEPLSQVTTPSMNVDESTMKARAAKVTTAQYIDIPLTQMRTVIAKRLLESKTTIPGIYFTSECRIDEIQKLRESLKSSGTNVSVNDFITKAVALSIRDVPAANAYWDTEEEIVMKRSSIDISIAVSTPTGLITPIIKNAHAKSLSTISTEIRELVEKARNNKLKPAEFMGGTFTISNLGMYGISDFSAIINPPQSCIMAVGGSRSELIRKETGEIDEALMMSVTLTADARIFDGEIVHSFLDAFRKYMEHPLPLLV